MDPAEDPKKLQQIIQETFYIEIIKRYTILIVQDMFIIVNRTLD